MAESSDSVSALPSGSVASTNYVIQPSPPLSHPKRSMVWSYFVYDQENICQTEVSRDHGDQGGPSKEICGASIAGKYPTNLKQHLRKDHYALYQEALVKEKAAEQKRKEASAKPLGTKQLSLAESFKGKSPYDKKSERYLTITKHVAIFIGSSNVPNSIVENAEFKSLIEVLDSRYPLPGRTLIGKELDKVLATFKIMFRAFFLKHEKRPYVLIFGQKRDLLQATLD